KQQTKRKSMFKKAGLFGFVSAVILAVAFALVANQGLTLANAPDALRIVLDVCLGLFVTGVGTFAIGFVVGINSVVDEATGGLFGKMTLGVVLASLVAATLEGGIVWLIASLLHMSGLSFAYVVGVAFLWGFFVSSLAFKRIFGVFGAFFGK